MLHPMNLINIYLDYSVFDSVGLSNIPLCLVSLAYYNL